MIRRLRVDNFGCLVNFELQLDRMHLLLGPNGGGKSTAFDAMRRIQRLLDGESLVEDNRSGAQGVFPTSTLTAWQSVRTQTFELQLSVGGHELNYEMVVEHEPDRGRARVMHEVLEEGGRPLFEFMEGAVSLYRDDGSAGPTYQFDWTRSALSMITPRNDNTVLTQFREYMSDLVIVAPNPAMMGDISHGPGSGLGVRPGERMVNVASWYHRLSQDQGLAIRVAEKLRQVLQGFSHFRYAQSGDQWRLMADMSAPVSHSVRLNALSDGQRMLAALYMLALATPPGGVLCIDEPGNNVALPELGPWLDLITDRCDDGDLQALMISHHPIMVEREAAACGLWFDRKACGPTQVAKLNDLSQSPVSVTSLIERGWVGSS